MNREKIHAWASAWLDELARSPLSGYDFEEHFGQECERMGFVLDWGASFFHAFDSDAFFHAEGFLRCVNTIDDAGFLGSALYSKWREIVKSWGPVPDGYWEDTVRWLAMGFLRLEQVTAKKGARAAGLRSVKKICLTGYNGSFRRWDEDTICGQRLIVHVDGRCRFVTKSWNGKKREKPFTISKKKAKQIMDAATLFGRGGRRCMEGKDDPMEVILDRGGWTLRLFDGHGRYAEYEGSLCGRAGAVGLLSLSEILREALRLPELWALDGRSREEALRRIVVQYVPAPGEAPFPGQPRKERLVIDRDTDRMTYDRGAARLILRGGASQLLDALEEEGVFSSGPIVPLPPGPIVYETDSSEETPPERSDLVPALRRRSDVERPGRYRLAVSYLGRPKRVWEGSFDLGELPEEWETFAEMAKEAFRSGTGGVLFDPAQYKWRRRRPGEYIYCSVVFEEGGNAYHYRTEDDSLHIGDRVRVPAGRENRPYTVTITDITYCLPEDAPYPPSRTKVILGRAD